MKIAPIHAEMSGRKGDFEPILVHTGQHYDEKMSTVFLKELGMPKPDVYLGVGSGSHAVQTANVMLKFEKVVTAEEPDWVVVVGDVNSTLACALVCSKLGVKVAHVEAGLRSRDRSMPEEVNRVLTDSIADLLFTHSEEANSNLLKEGVNADRIKFVGNVMIDSLFKHLEEASRSDIRERLEVNRDRYGILTLHRPSNVDRADVLGPLIDTVIEIARRIPVVFPAHPRTVAKLKEFDLTERIAQSGVAVVEPLGYLDFIKLVSDARFVMTDSGGLQEETTALSIPCLTLRNNTERNVTIRVGSNRLVGTEPDSILAGVAHILEDDDGSVGTTTPPLWDGKTAPRICELLARTRFSE